MALALGLLLLLMGFGGAPNEEAPIIPTASDALYIPGLYTTELVLGNQTVDVEVMLTDNNIESIELANMDDNTACMYPLLQPAFDDIYAQILATQSVENITYSSDSKYTSLVLLEAIRNSVDKGRRR